jgi:RimJ/RimL family protein N-acetyltransferase
MGPARLKLSEFDRRTLDLSWEWFKNEELRRLTMTPAFTRDQQLEFFRSIPSRKGYLIWSIDLVGWGPIGAAGLKNCRSCIAEYWGYIGPSQFWGCGLGGELMALIERKAISLGLKELELRVYRSNVRALRLYSKRGFVAVEPVDDSGQIRMWKSLVEFHESSHVGLVDENQSVQLERIRALG